MMIVPRRREHHHLEPGEELAYTESYPEREIPLDLLSEPAGPSEGERKEKQA